MKLLQGCPMCLNGSLLLTFLCSAASGVSDSLWHCGLHPARLLCPWEFSSQEYWGGFPCPPSGDLPNPGIGPRSPECRQILGVTLEYMNSVPPLWGLLILHQAPHTHTHTQPFWRRLTTCTFSKIASKSMMPRRFSRQESLSCQKNKSNSKSIH